MKSSKFNRSIVTALMLGGAALPLRAQWNQNSGVGPYTYTDPANWVGGIITNIFSIQPISGLTLQFTNDFILTNGVLINFAGSSNVIFQSDSATPRTLHISLGNFLRTNNNGGTITIGTTNNPLVLDLYGHTRTIGGGTALSTSSSAICTMNINAQIVDQSAGPTNGITCGGGNIYAYLLNTNNSFLGPVTFASLRGGGFANIKPIGGGPSALGAPLDSTNGTITTSDGGSFGTLKYLGTGDTSDRPFVWTLTAYHTNQSWTGDFEFVNAGTGLLKLSGQWTFPTNRTANSEFVINAATAPIELDGYINGSGNANGTYTTLLFAGAPAGSGTNRITLTGATNDFRDFMISNVVVAYNSIASAGTPSSLGAGTNIVLGGGNGGSTSGSIGQGASLQYFGPSTTFSRNIQLLGGLSTSYWALDNAGANTELTWSNNITWNLPGAVIGFNPRYLFINPNISCTNTVLSLIPDANVVVAGTPIGTIVAAANPVGSVINNGGVVQLLNPANTFAGGLQVAYARTVRVMTLADIGLPSSIGTAQNPYTVGTPAIQLTGINLGSTDSQRGGVLSYVGTNNASSNQRITILGSATGNLDSGTLRNDSPNNSALHLTDTGAWNLYSTMPKCLAVLGGSALATNTVDSVMPDVNGVAGSGSLLVNGSAWRLTANQTYSGTTLVANATLVLDASVAAGLGFTVGAGGVLAGTGTVNEDVTVQTGGTVSPGDSIGTLTINGNLTNNGSLRMEIKASDGTSDLITGVSTLAYGGTLSVTNIAGTLTNGASFRLFSAGAYQGSFSSISPVIPGSGLAWDLTGLTNNGTLKVVAGASNPPHIGGIATSGSSVVISGSGGTAGANYYVVTSTNVALPLTNWTRLATNVFDGSGNFNVTNLMSGPREFFRIELP